MATGRLSSSFFPSCSKATLLLGPLLLSAATCQLSEMPVQAHLRELSPSANVLVPHEPPIGMVTLLGSPSSPWNPFEQILHGLLNQTVPPAGDLTIQTDQSPNSQAAFPLGADEREIFLSYLSVRIVLIVLYTIVFLAIFIGNLLLISALSLNREMLTVTNIFLLNLSIADLCVAFFCVYQNLSLYLLSNWIFGDFLCRMYHFIHAMSYTASVCIHVVIAIERYLALVKPFWARVLLTSHRLRMVIIAVWFLSAFACSPRLFIYKTIVSNFGINNESQGEENQEEILCVISYQLYNPKIYDVCYITFFFALPLVLIGFLYSRISFHLWRSTSSAHRLSSARLMSPNSSHKDKNRKSTKSSVDHSRDGEYFEVECNELNRCVSYGNRYTAKCQSTGHLFSRQRSLNATTDYTSASDQCRAVEATEENTVRPSLLGSSVHKPATTSATTTFTNAFSVNHRARNDRSGSTSLWPVGSGGSSVKATKADFYKARRINSRSSIQMERILSQRKKVVRLMISIACSFALLSVPFHLRKLLQHFCPQYDVASDLATIFTLATTLLLYANSAMNPIFLMCFSTKMRRLMFSAGASLLCCQCPANRNRQGSSKYRARFSVSLRSMPDRSITEPHTNFDSIVVDQEKDNL